MEADADKALHASWIRALEAAIQQDPDLCKRYVPADRRDHWGIECDMSHALTFEPHVASEYVRVAHEIKKIIPIDGDRGYFSIIRVNVEAFWWGVSNRGDDGDAFSFHLYVGPRFPLLVETKGN